MDAFQKDFLTEVLNIGLGRAGAALSEMSGAHVSLTVPDITVCKAEELPIHLSIFGQDNIISVTQPFEGILCGDAILVLSTFSGRTIATSLFRHLLSSGLEESEIASAITELGNIVINHFVGSWSEIFYDRFHFGVPQYQCCTLQKLLEGKLNTPANKTRESMYAVCAEAHLDVPEFFAMVSLVTLFDRISLEKLVGSLVTASQNQPAP